MLHLDVRLHAYSFRAVPTAPSQYTRKTFPTIPAVVCLQVIFSRPLSFLQSVPAPYRYSAQYYKMLSAPEKSQWFFFTPSPTRLREPRELCSCCIWPLLWTTVFLDCLNLKHVTVWMTSSVLYLLTPGCGLQSWKAFVEINAFMKKGVQLITWFTVQLRGTASEAEDNCHIHPNTTMLESHWLAFAYRRWVLCIPLQALWYLPKCWWILIFVNTLHLMPVQKQICWKILSFCCLITKDS